MLFHKLWNKILIIILYVFYFIILHREIKTKTTFVIENDNCIVNITQIGIIWVDKTLKGELTFTKQGSILHLLYGEN